MSQPPSTGRRDAPRRQSPQRGWAARIALILFCWLLLPAAAAHASHAAGHRPTTHVGDGVYGAGQSASGAGRQYGNVQDLATGDRYSATRAAIDMAAARREYTEGTDRVQVGVESAVC